MIRRVNGLKSWQFVFPIVAFIALGGLLLFGGQASAQLPASASPAKAGITTDSGTKSTKPVISTNTGAKTTKPVITNNSGTSSTGTNDAGGKSAIMSPNVCPT